MQKILLTFPLLLFSLFALAQEKIPFIDHESVYLDVSESAEKGDYARAIDHLERINKNDSTFCSVMVSKSYYLLALKRYDEALSVINEGLEASCEDVHSSFYINKVVALLGQDKSEEAAVVCDSALHRFPMNKTIWYNRGVALEKSGKIDQAVKAYKKVILLDPLYTKSYLQLGNICYRQELMGQALMAFNMYLLLQPDADGAFGVLQSLNNIVQTKNENIKDPNLVISKDDGAFAEIDLILTNRLALQEGYETGNEINIALTRQNHAMIESLKSFSGNDGFWDDIFVPFYQWIASEQHFDDFTYTLAYSIENKEYKKIVEKRTEDIIDFVATAKEKWVNLVQTGTVRSTGRKVHFYQDGYTKGIGYLENGQFVGAWDLFDDEGKRTGQGNFSPDGTRDGEWTWYNDQGAIREIANYVKGKLEGENRHYYDNGQTKIHSGYKTDSLHGAYRYFNEKGSLQQKKFFKSGSLDGNLITYHETGEAFTKSKTKYKGGKTVGTHVEFFPTGAVSKKVEFKDGLAHGPEIHYYPNGTVAIEANSANGDLEGKYRTFYSDGTTKENGQVEKGYYSGRWKTFYPDGILQSDFTFQGGEIDGEYRFYDFDGKLHYLYNYRKGEFIAYTFFDKEGAVIDENRKQGGEFYYKGYSPSGVKTAEGLYDVKGGKKGLWKYFSSNGVLTEEGEYLEDKPRGKYRTFFNNGKVQSISEYQEDTLKRYYLSYYRDGKMKSQGWYKDDNAHGEWRSYAPNGKVTEITFYHKGQFHGEQLFFNNEGIKSGVSIYEFGDIKKDIAFDRDGKVIYKVDYDGHGKQDYELVYKHHNEKPNLKISYRNGVKHGPYSQFDFRGTKRATGNYLNGQMHGEWTWFHENGVIETKANFLNGDRNGEYLNFYPEGNRESEYYYILDELRDVSVSYYENGIVKTRTEYGDDVLHGRKEFYSPDGQLQLIRFYNHGRLVGYSHLGRNSKELPMIPLKNESAQITAYYDNGNISREMEYRNGALVNTYRQYYYSGQLLDDMLYMDGEYHGAKTEYFENGNVKTQENYHLGTRHGLAREYFESGGLKSETNYSYGKKEGTSRHVDERGEVLKEEIYFNDNIEFSNAK
ncbi:MAG TPA: tetratricopeptide repeat protein [Pricia sp.]|nr:tetratricopeptide repeat protein [Pricia sp.]